jgi:uncharacterized protein YgiM (DUF1202 family)
MKNVMYVIIGLLTVLVVILAYMSANKPPVDRTPPVVEETRPEREILFNLTPVEEDEDAGVFPGFDPDEEEEDEDADPNITKLDLIMYATSDVNVRAGHSTDFDRVGSLSANQEVQVIGQSKETGWYMIEYRDDVAFVSENFLTETAPAAAPPPAAEPPAEEPPTEEPPAENPED